MTPTSTAGAGPLAARARRLEGHSGLDALARKVDSITAMVVPPPGRLHDELRGRSLGHPVHAVLTDLPLGLWTGTVLLDLTRPPGHRAAARRLLGVGVLAAVPTALTGLTDFTALGPRARRVAAVHAFVNGAGNALAAGSWLARRRGHDGVGAVLSAAAIAAASGGAFLGGHVAQAMHEPSTVPGGPAAAD